MQGSVVLDAPKCLGSVSQLHPACLTSGHMVGRSDGAPKSAFHCHIAQYRGRTFALPVSVGDPEASCLRKEKRCSFESPSPELAVLFPYHSNWESCHGEAVDVARHHSSPFCLAWVALQSLPPAFTEEPSD